MKSEQAVLPNPCLEEEEEEEEEKKKNTFQSCAWGTIRKLSKGCGIIFRQSLLFDCSFHMLYARLSRPA
jgi:hypothetical protein